MCDYELTLKFVIIGDPSTGKTSLTKKYLNNKFDDTSQPTIGNDYFKQKRFVNETAILVQFWDTAGQERYRSTCLALYKDVLALMIVYDVTNRHSFTNITFWHETVLKFCQTRPVVILVGNKTDLTKNRNVSVEEGRMMAEKLDMMFIETSAKNNSNYCVQKAFDLVLDSIGSKLVQEENKRQIQENRTLTDSIIRLKLNEKNDKWCC